MMENAILYCSACQSTLQTCRESRFMFGEDTETVCDARFCPQGHGIMSPVGKCPLGKSNCRARSIRATLT